MSTIRQDIHQILDIRHRRKPRLERAQKGLTAWITGLDRLSELGADAGTSQEARADLTQPVIELMGSLGNLKARIAELQAKLANLMARYSKNTINIGVTGKARQGKSTLLQKISGLDGSVIPVADGLPVTGAKSKIIHQEGDPHAIVDFYTQEEFLTGVVNPYFAELDIHPAPANLDEFRKRLPDAGKVLPAKHGVFKKLLELQANFGRFSRFLSHRSGRISLDEVHKFVSQEDGRVHYHAVNCANIFVRFPNGDVTGVGLVDLPGLGEIALGHSQKIISSLRQEVDAVMLIKLPAETGTLWDKTDYDVFDCIKVAVPEIELKDWLFVLLNEHEKANNLKQVELLKKRPPDVGSPLTILSANCRSAEDVDRRVFAIVLDRLATTLPQTDKHYLESLAEQFVILAGDLEILVKALKDLFEAGPSSEEISSNLCRKFLTEVKQSLEMLVATTRPLGNSKSFWERIRGIMANETSTDFQTAITEACEAVKQVPPIPTAKELASQFFDKGGWPAVVQQELHHLRSHLTKKLAEKLDMQLDQIVNGVLTRMLNGVLSSPLDRLVPAAANYNVDPRGRIRAFRALLNAKRQPSLVSAMDHALDFTYSYQSHFHYRVRKAMDPLDPLTPSGEIATTGRHAEYAQELVEVLTRRYLDVVATVQKQFQSELQDDPFKAIFAMAEEIRDRLVRAKGVEHEWQSFLLQRRAVIWPQELSQLEAETARCLAWQDALDGSLNAANEARTAFAELTES